MLGTIAVVGLAPTPVLVGFAIFYIATAAYYRLPIPVQPMKAVAAVLLTAHVTPAALAASGVMIGGVLLILGAAGWITRLARLVPQSILVGLQLGLGAALAVVSLDLMGSAPAIAIFDTGAFARAAVRATLSVCADRAGSGNCTRPGAQGPGDRVRDRGSDRALDPVAALAG